MQLNETRSEILVLFLQYNDILWGKNASIFNPTNRDAEVNVRIWPTGILESNADDFLNLI